MGKALAVMFLVVFFVVGGVLSSGDWLLFLASTPIAFMAGIVAVAATVFLLYLFE